MVTRSESPTAQLPIFDDETTSPMADVEYRATSLWLADVLLKGNQLLGTAPGGCDSEQRRGWHADYNGVLLAMAQSLCAQHPELRDTMVKHAIASMSAHRRALAAQLRAASALGTVPGTGACSFAAFDWMLAASEDEADVCLTPPLGVPAREYQVLERGNVQLRALLADLSSAFMDVEQSRRAAEAMATLVSPATERLVRNELVMQAVVGLFDCARLAAGARVNMAVFGERTAPLSPDVARAEAGRADAYAAMRLYTGLQTIIALMMMGASRRYEGDDQNRGRWATVPLGKSVLDYREEVSLALHAYDHTKRQAAMQAGRSYVAQTPGYVAALQEQAATLAMRAHYEERSRGLHEALVCALSEPGMFEVRVAGGAQSRCTFWQAVRHVSEAREDAWSGAPDGRVAPLGVAIQQTWSAFIFGMGTADPNPSQPIVAPTPAMAKAMRQAMDNAPPIANFYGRDFAETERKVLARAVKEGRDPEGREAGEAFGFRQEWMGCLSGARMVRPPVAPTAESAARVRAAITVLAAADVLATAGGDPRRLPVASGNAIHYIHAVAAAKQPSQLRLVWKAGRNPAHSFLLDKGDPKNAGAVLQTDSDIRELHRDLKLNDLYLGRKQMFVEKVAERTAVPYRAWSGGALATDPFHAFFSEVWRRFNENLKRPGGPWSDKLARWIAHYEAGTQPPRGGGESKLIHPWRVMFLQQGVGRALLEEQWGETHVLQTCTTPAERAAARVHRALLHRLINVYDYPPWASHLIRRFCSMEEHRSKRKREMPPPPESLDTRVARQRSVSPTVGRPAPTPVWA